MKRLKDQGEQGLYPLRDYPTIAEFERLGIKAVRGEQSKMLLPRSTAKLRAKPTGEFRAPKAGEWFLSGAIVEAYRTKNDLTQEYFIAKLVRVRTETRTIIEQEE